MIYIPSLSLSSLNFYFSRVYYYYERKSYYMKSYGKVAVFNATKHQTVISISFKVSTKTLKNG